MAIESDHWEFRACWKGLSPGHAYRLRVIACDLEPPHGVVTIDDGVLNAALVAKLAEGKALFPDGIILDDIGELATRLRIVTSSTAGVEFELQLLGGNNRVLGEPYTLKVRKASSARVMLRLVAGD